MKLPSYVKPYPKIWKLLPFVKEFGGNSIYPTIYLREDFYRDLLRDNPHLRSIALLKHEESHRKRQQEIGLLRFLLKNYFSRSARLEEELTAYQVSMQIWKKHGLEFPIEYLAKNLSGWMYLWATSYKNARKKLEKMWEEA